MKQLFSPLLIFSFSIVIVLTITACGASTTVTPEPLTPTLSPTPEHTVTPTPEPIFTPIPTEVPADTQVPPTPTEEPMPPCTGILSDRILPEENLFLYPVLYPIPSNSIKGVWLIDREPLSGTDVEVIGQLNEPVWYRVSFTNQIGWVLQAHVRLIDSNCQVPQVSLVETLGLHGSPVLEDTFRDSQNWEILRRPDQRPERVPNSDYNYTLSADGYEERIALSAPALEDVAAFELATAYWRQNGGDQTSYVGLQYGTEAQYFEIRVLGTCDIEVMTSDGFYEKQLIRAHNQCKDGISDFLFVRWDGSGILEIGQNDMGHPYRFNIGTSLPATGKIQLIVGEAIAQFDFIAVTEN